MREPHEERAVREPSDREVRRPVERVERVERDDLWDGRPQPRLELPAHALDELPAYVLLDSGLRYRDRRADAPRDREVR